jgi:hypothetical protein
MFRILLSFIFLIIINQVSYSQQRPPNETNCMPFSVMVDGLARSGFIPVFRSKIEKDSGVIVSINPDMKRMTLIVYAVNDENKSVGACILGMYNNLDYDKDILNILLEKMVGEKI